jgi:energy-coupling factor transporter ATP-binding protein EcfA2
MTTTRPLHLTLCEKLKTSKVSHVSKTWSAIADWLTRPPTVTAFRESLKWPLFVPFKMLTTEDGALMRETAYGEAYSRCTANVEFADLLCLDIDNDPTKLKGGEPFTIDKAKVAFNGLTYALYTSFNHRNDDKHSVDKFRVVLPLNFPVTYEEFTERKQAMKKLFPFIDPASLSISQPFFVPVAHPDRLQLHQAFYESGDWLDLFLLDATKPPDPKVSAAYVETGETNSNLPEIKVEDGTSYRADQLYAILSDGYQYREACFRINDGADAKPGCFVFRKGTGLLYFDPAVGKSEFIAIKKVKRAETQNPFENEEDVETTPLWIRKRPSQVGTAQPKQAHPNSLISYVQHPVEILRLDQRYLPDDLHLQIPAEGITVIKSPKGTGKTELLKHMVGHMNETGESVMLLGHRVYLLNNLAVRTNLDYYLDYEDGQVTQSMAICLNSLTRIKPGLHEPYDTIIIDESEQVLQALISKTLHSDLSVIFNNLIWLFRHAKRIICLDADLSADLTIELIREIRGEKETDAVVGVINSFRIGEGQTTKLYEKKMHLLADALDAVRNGEKVFIASNSRKFATVVDAIIKDLGRTSLLVTAETNEHPDTQAFILDPTNECTQYDAIVSSPTLSTGVSIDGNHFTKVYGFFSIQPGTFQDVDQAVSRVRQCNDVSVWVQGHDKKPYVPSEQILYDKALERERESVKRLWYEKPIMTQGQLLWARVLARISYMIALWSINKDEEFSKLRRELGFVIQAVPIDDERNAIGAEVFGRFKHVGVDRAKAIFEAPDIDEDAAAELGRKKQRSYDEQLSLEKYRLMAHLKEDWSVDTVAKALKQELLQSLARLRTLHTLTDEMRMHYDKEDRYKNQNTFSPNHHRVLMRELLQRLYTAGNIDPDNLLANVDAGGETEIPRETMLAIAQAYADKKHDFNYYFDVRIKDPTHEKNLKKVWDATVGQALALKIVRKKCGTKAKRLYRYYLHPEANDLVHKVRRGKSFAIM